MRGFEAADCCSEPVLKTKIKTRQKTVAPLERLHCLSKREVYHIERYTRKYTRKPTQTLMWLELGPSSREEDEEEDEEKNLENLRANENEKRSTHTASSATRVGPLQRRGYRADHPPRFRCSERQEARQQEEAVEAEQRWRPAWRRGRR